jgi:hypothetical protein
MPEILLFSFNVIAIDPIFHRKGALCGGARLYCNAPNKGWLARPKMPNG